MTDTKILNWIAANLTALHGLPNDTVEIDWRNPYGEHHRTIGHNLRDAVIRAAAGEGVMVCFLD